MNLKEVKIFIAAISAYEFYGGDLLHEIMIRCQTEEQQALVTENTKEQNT